MKLYEIIGSNSQIVHSRNFKREHKVSKGNLLLKAKH